MRYVSVNEFATFEVHDCEVTDLTFEGGKAVCELDSIDVATANSLNDYPTDMQAEPVRATFEGIAIEKIETAGCMTCNSEGEVIKSVPRRTLDPEEYATCLQELMDEIGHLYLFGSEALDSPDGRFLAWIDFGGIEVTFSYARLTVEWEAFTKKAWYVDFNKQGEGL